MKVYLARHTETNYNVAGLLNSDPNVDVHLTEKGTVQAKQLAKKLKNEDFEVIYVSNLPRTMQTVGHINKFHNKPIIKDARLCDNKSGFEGQPAQVYIDAIDKAKDKFNAKFNDGESFKEIMQRVESFVNELKNTQYKEVLIITHGAIIEFLYAIKEGVRFDLAKSFDIPQGEFVTLDL